MTWTIDFEEEFDVEYEAMDESFQLELLARLEYVEYFGPEAGRPPVDTLNGSQYPNMKELRFKFDGGVWRVAFAFDSNRKGIVLGPVNTIGKSRLYTVDENYSIAV